MSTLTNQSPLGEPEKANDWQNHEHIADSTLAHVHQLVDELGSVELAKHVIDTVGGSTCASERHALESRLAESLAFGNFAALTHRSTSVDSNDGRRWFKTQLDDNTWAVWNDDELEADRHFATEQEALGSIPRDHALSGSSLLG